MQQRRVHAKPPIYRSARVRGELLLSPSSRRAIRVGNVTKGDPRIAAEIAGIAAMKRTAELLPHCHTIPLTGSSVTVRLARSGVVAEAVAEAVWRTGVEMEALVGATVALLTVWDMVKYLEKNERGQ
ncbi:MAG: cyclic pyranopterin monophosphate synthase MoaC, partial [Thermoplasmata archaeon]